MMRNLSINHYRKLKHLSLLAFFLCFSQALVAQQMAIDYTPTKKRESSFKVNLFKQGIIGINTLQHIDASAEVLRVQYDSSNGLQLSMSLFTTRSIWVGNKNDQLNLLSYMHNPIGGLINGSVVGKIPLSIKKDASFKIGVRLGQRFIQGFPIDPLYSRYFMDNYGSIGPIYQRLIYENARENKNLYLVFHPSLNVHNSSAKKREQFFDNQLQTTVYGYGLQLGFELNKTFRFSLMGHQLLNANEDSELGKFVFRFSTGYIF